MMWRKGGAATRVIVAATITATMGVVAVGCAGDPATTTNYSEIEATTECADIDGVSEIKTTQGMTCDEAHEIAQQWVRACFPELSKRCVSLDGDYSCWSAGIGETSTVKCADSEDRLTHFVTAVSPK